MTKLTAIRAAWGTALLLAPDAVLRRVDRRTIDPRTRRVAQVLGGRELLQALVASRHHSRASILSGAAVDATHAATMLALAIRLPRLPTSSCGELAHCRNLRGRRPTDGSPRTMTFIRGYLMCVAG